MQVNLVTKKWLQWYELSPVLSAPLMSPAGGSIVALTWTLTVKLSTRSVPLETETDGFPT